PSTSTPTTELHTLSLHDALPIFERIIAGEPREKALPEFLDSFYLAPTTEARMDAIVEEPRLTGDPQLDALAGAIADYLAGLYRLDRKSTRLNSSHRTISYAVFCL